jgi:TRAP-type C4-dicarboxylate transport system substrate-binding protein
VKKDKFLKIALTVCLLVVLTSMVVLAEQPKYNLKFSTAATPLEPQTQGFMKFAEMVEQLTGGNNRWKH